MRAVHADAGHVGVRLERAGARLDGVPARGPLAVGAGEGDPTLPAAGFRGQLRQDERLAQLGDRLEREHVAAPAARCQLLDRQCHAPALEGRDLRVGHVTAIAAVLRSIREPGGIGPYRGGHDRARARAGARRHELVAGPQRQPHRAAIERLRSVLSESLAYEARHGGLVPGAGDALRAGLEVRAVHALDRLRLLLQEARGPQPVAEVVAGALQLRRHRPVEDQDPRLRHPRGESAGLSHRGSGRSRSCASRSRAMRGPSRRRRAAPPASRDGTRAHRRGA